MNLNLLSPYVRRGWRCTLKPGKKIKKRILVDYEIILVTDGVAKVKIGENEYTVMRGEVIFIPPGVEHEIEVLDRDFVQPHVHFDPIYTADSEKRRVSYRSAKDISSEQLALLQEDIFADFGIPYVFRPAEPKRFQRYLFEIIDAKEAKRAHFNIICKSKMLMLLRLIFKQFEKGSAEEDSENVAELVKEYIDNNFEQTITLENLEVQFGVNRFTLIRKFKEAYGQTVISYYNERRLKEAKRLLLVGEHSVSGIANLLSFADLYSFSRFFKIHTGLSPRKYREGYLRGQIKEDVL